ncbi:hypothetical protein [Paenibacillus sp. ACRRY]|uniref:hypothetical protein n=1 Tax=Paenibacillus sp. ACRRY TaxID=2918208 RepID=UPI001EF6047F|nr:hypothetical protein [Paenibacillus sp. ACRRY]MCG7382655.1 hypothetical protein [Paenibacillus sp. ACRRY]
MIAVLLFAGLYLMDWSFFRSSKKTIRYGYFILLIFYLTWNTLAVSWPGWPNPNDMINLVFGWADQISQ